MNKIVPAVLSGLGIAYARGDFTKAGLAAIGVVDLARMTIMVCAFGLAAVLIVKTFDRLLDRGKVRPVANHGGSGSSDLGGTGRVRFRDLGSKAR